MKWPIPVAALSGTIRLLGMRFRILQETGMSVCCKCVLSGGGLCDGPIPRPESYRAGVCIRYPA